jgi:protein gp37
MAENTPIGWCDDTFNPWRGCKKISAGCKNCYAAAGARRFPKVLGVWGKDGTRVLPVESGWEDLWAWDRKARREGRRRRIFSGSYCDVFEDRPDLAEPRQQLLAVIDRTTHLDWLLLTKRPENVLPLLHQCVAQVYAEHAAGAVFAERWLNDTPPRNVWLGVTVEDHKDGLPRIDILRQIPAIVRFLSCEPLLEDLGTLDLTGIDWVIVGGESGPNRRPMELAWLESIVRQCQAAAIPCFVKQDVGRTQGEQGRIPDELWSIKEFPQVEPCPRMI